jgi:hypothetical protein
MKGLAEGRGSVTGLDGLILRWDGRYSDARCVLRYKYRYAAVPGPSSRDTASPKHPRYWLDA